MLFAEVLWKFSPATACPLLSGKYCTAAFLRRLYRNTMLLALCYFTPPRHVPLWWRMPTTKRVRWCHYRMPPIISLIWAFFQALILIRDIRGISYYWYFLFIEASADFFPDAFIWCSHVSLHAMKEGIRDDAIFPISVISLYFIILITLLGNNAAWFSFWYAYARRAFIVITLGDAPTAVTRLSLLFYLPLRQPLMIAYIATACYYALISFAGISARRHGLATSPHSTAAFRAGLRFDYLANYDCFIEHMTRLSIYVHAFRRTRWVFIEKHSSISLWLREDITWWVDDIFILVWYVAGRNCFLLSLTLKEILILKNEW